jgi:DNA polymerase-3 subunit delta'
MTEVTPSTNTELYGHEAAFTALLADHAAEKLAHGWIFSGPKGIGKATLAYHFARYLLSYPKDMDEGVYHRVAAGSHSDLLIIEQEYDPKKEEVAREITVEQARKISEFLSLTPGESQWRVVIVDSADALNVNAANAILKILEEPPPQAILILIAHNSGRLLPTIRSRCRQMKLQPLQEADFRKIMRHIAPDVDGSALTTLAHLSNNAPGLAAEWHEQGAAMLYQQMLEVLSPLPALDYQKLHALADGIGGGSVHRNWQLFTRLTLRLLERITKTAAGIALEEIVPDEREQLRALVMLHPAGIWALKWQQCADQFSLADALHLDYKQVIISWFHSVATAEGFQLRSASA